MRWREANQGMRVSGDQLEDIRRHKMAVEGMKWQDKADMAIEGMQLTEKGRGGAGVRRRIVAIRGSGDQL